MTNKNMVVLNVRVPQGMIREIDREADELGYPNRSAYIREAVIRMSKPAVKEKILEELIKRSIEARYDYVKHDEVAKKLRG